MSPAKKKAKPAASQVLCEYGECTEKVKFTVTWSDNHPDARQKEQTKLLCGVCMEDMLTESFSSVFGRDVKIKRYVGFARMSPEKRQLVSAVAGRASHKLGRGHEFTPQEAKEAAKKRHALGGPSLGDEEPSGSS